MGRSPKPLTILVTDPDMLMWQEVEELKGKGHVVYATLSPEELWERYRKAPSPLAEGKVPTQEQNAAHGFYLSLPDVGKMDILLGPNCWRMTPALRRYFPQAIAAARKARYPKRGDGVS